MRRDGLKKILTYLKPYRLRVAWALALKGAGAFSELFLPRILTYIIDDVIPLERLSLVFMWGGIMIACSVVCVVTNIVGNRAASAVARDASRTIRHDLFLRTTYLSCAQADRSSGSRKRAGIRFISKKLEAFVQISEKKC